MTITKIPLKTDLSFDLAKMEQAANDFDGLSMVYICNPNNPTAMITPYSQLDKWLVKTLTTFLSLMKLTLSLLKTRTLQVLLN